ncbi:carbohydrate ABC transporter permease [Paenibacillus sp. J5C_2022]|nr:carbohydrate ABC transporter permease [Paenibacillus sp. J5C2022]
MLLPIVFIMNHAFKPINELFLYPPRFFVENPTFFHFKQLFLRTQTLIVPFSRYFFNSLVSTGFAVLGIIVFSVAAAYAFSKQHFPGKQLFFSFIITSLMFAPETVGIPRYMVIAKLGIMNTYFVHILPLIAAPVGVFLLKQFIDQVPNELLEAAKIDGAKDWVIILRIIVPVCLPAIATVGILAFQSTWSQTETSALYTQTESMKTLPYYAMTLTNGVANNIVGQGMAAVAGLMIFMPNLIIFLLFQRKILATMAHSGIK